jgi:hypothetical protein
MALIEFEDYQKFPLDKEDKEIYDRIVSMGGCSLFHLLVKLFGEDAKRISITIVGKGNKLTIIP